MALDKADGTNDKEVTCSYCNLVINPGRGVHGIGRRIDQWLHHLCKEQADRKERSYLRSHSIDVNQENGCKSRRSPAKTDGSNEETSQPGTNHQMALTEAEELISLIHSESSLRAVIHRIGNGEFTVIVGEDYYLWSKEDWNQLPTEASDEISVETEPKIPELVH